MVSGMNLRIFGAAALAGVAVCCSTAVMAQASGNRGGGGCAGVGGGDATGIGAALACGLPPPAAATPQYNGPGVLSTGDGLPLGSKCVETQQLPTGTTGASGNAPSHEYVNLTPSVSGNPETGLTANGSIHSPLPIGSPSGPHDVAVPPQPVKTAAQQNAAAAAEAQGIADQFNAYQQQQIDDATTAKAFENPGPAVVALLATRQYSASSFYLPPSPPMAGVEATSEDATTWTLREVVYVNAGRVVHDEVASTPDGAPVYGPEYCSQLNVAGADPPFLASQVTTTVPAFTAQINRVADAIWRSFRRGSIVSLPANGSPTYIGVPTCVGLDTGLPTGSGTPNPFTLTLPLTLTGVAGQVPVAVSGRVAVSIVGGGVHWDFHDPAGDTTVHGQDSSDPTPSTGTPTYDAATGTWPDAASVCSTYHQYRSLSAAPGVPITATEHFHIEVSGVYSTGSVVPVSFSYAYEPADSPVAWSSGPYPVYQIEAVPYAPGA